MHPAGRLPLFDVKLTQYYKAVRFRYMRFLALFRESIFSTLNEAVLLAGKELDFDAQIVLSGIPTAHDIELVANKLNDGATNIFELVESISYW